MKSGCHERLNNICVGIAGAGGLGSQLAACLVRTGFQRIRVVDYDRVEFTNLNRQYYFPHQVGMFKVHALRSNLLSINPRLHFEGIVARINSEVALRLFWNCEVVAECLDLGSEKSRFISALLPTGKFIVASSGVGGYGDSNSVRVHRIKENLVVVGDLKSDIETFPPFGPKVMVAAAMQADVILHHTLHGY